MNEVKFYKTLYTSEDIDVNTMKEYISKTNLEYKHNETEANLCEGIFSKMECTEAIDNMKLNKSPGLDGITCEFYKRF